MVFHELWPRLEPYLFVIPYDKDGGHEDPRIRIELRDLPDRLSQEAQFASMACVACARPIHFLRRREGDGLDRLYYAPACSIAVRVSCSRTAAAAAEYDRFKAFPARPTTTQLSLF